MGRLRSQRDDLVLENEHGALLSRKLEKRIGTRRSQSAWVGEMGDMESGVEKGGQWAGELIPRGH